MRKTLQAMLMAAVVAVPASAQDYPNHFDPTATRAPGMQLLIWDSSIVVVEHNALGDSVGVSRGDFVAMSLETLLAGLVDFPDMIPRYVALGDWVSGDPAPVFDSTAMLAGNSEVGDRAAFQAPTADSTAERVWVAIALPSSVTSPYIATGVAGPTGVVTNTGFNQAAGFAPQAGTVVIGGQSYTIWVTRGAHRAERYIASEVWFFFSPPMQG